jgi:hypothetical protein
MRQITIPAGERTRVFQRRFSSIPQEVAFTVTGDRISGKVERIGSRWILGRTRSEQPLAPVNRLRKGYWDTFYEVFVVSDYPVVVEVARPRMARLVLVLALVVLVAAVAVIAVTLGR